MGFTVKGRKEGRDALAAQTQNQDSAEGSGEISAQPPTEAGAPRPDRLYLLSPSLRSLSIVETSSQGSVCPPSGLRLLGSEGPPQAPPRTAGPLLPDLNTTEGNICGEAPRPSERLLWPPSTGSWGSSSQDPLLAGLGWRS